MLGRRQESARLLVVGSYRPVDAIVTGHPLRALIQELRVRRQCEDIALPFLREQHVAAYLAQRFGGHAFPSEMARAVHQRTDGNPLFMVRVLDELVALRVLEPEDDRWRLRGSVRGISHAVPDSLRALVEKQIERLQPEAQRVLEAASVLGTEFTTGSVAAGLDLDPLTIEDRCDELVRQGSSCPQPRSSCDPTGRRSHATASFTACIPTPSPSGYRPGGACACTSGSGSGSSAPMVRRSRRSPARWHGTSRRRATTAGPSTISSSRPGTPPGASPMRTHCGCSSRRDRWFIIWRRTPAPRWRSSSCNAWAMRTTGAANGSSAPKRTKRRCGRPPPGPHRPRFTRSEA